LNDNTQLQKISWASTNQIVCEKLKTEINHLTKESLESYEKLTLSLIVIANKIMSQKYPLSSNLLIEEKKCKNCTQIIKYPIKTLCCKQFVCINCLSDNEVKYGKCMICGKYLYRNKTQFQNLTKRLCLTHWKTERLKIKDKERILENAIKELIMPSKQIKENMLTKEVIRIIQKVDMKVNLGEYKKVYAKLALYFANMGFQIHIMLNLGHGWYPSYRYAYINNILPLSIIPFKYMFFDFYSIPRTICTHSDRKYVIWGEIEKLSLSWLNLFMIWYFPKNDFFANNNSPIYCVIFITYWYIKLCILQQKPLKLQNIFDEF